MAQQKLTIYTKDNQFVDTVWFEKLANRIKYIMEDSGASQVEIKFQLAWSKIEAMYRIGKAINDVSEKVNPLDPLLHEVAKLSGISVREIKYAVKFVKTYPKLDSIPGGKLATWNKIKEAYLTESSKKDPEVCRHKNKHVVQYEVCEDCGERKKLDDHIEEQE